VCVFIVDIAANRYYIQHITKAINVFDEVVLLLLQFLAGDVCFWSVCLRPAARTFHLQVSETSVMTQYMKM